MLGWIESTNQRLLNNKLGVMRRRIFISLGVVLVLALFYELTFRYVTASCGEVDMKAQPPRVYYSEDLMASLPWRRMLFGFRTALPFGKVKLCPNLYVDGGRFYRHLPDGSWQDLTDTFIEYQKTKQ
jgi:hypothetical protein